MIQMAEKGIGGGIYHTIYQSSKVNKYLKDYKQNKEPSGLTYWDAHNLCRWQIYEKLPVEKLNGKSTFKFGNFLKKLILKE